MFNFKLKCLHSHLHIITVTNFKAHVLDDERANAVQLKWSDLVLCHSKKCLKSLKETLFHDMQ